jgi:hypothetical protein
MKLPDFRQYEPLNRLKEQMSIHRNEYETIGVAAAAGGLTVEKPKTVLTEGIDVRPTNVTPAPAHPPLPETPAE